jgi:hypothetical protein
MGQNESPDFLQETDEEQADRLLTPETVEARWQQLCSMDLRGMQANFSCLASEGYELNGTVERVERVPERGAVLHLTGTTTQQDPEEGQLCTTHAEKPCGVARIEIPGPRPAPDIRADDIVFRHGGHAIDGNLDGFGRCLCIGSIRRLT